MVIWSLFDFHMLGSVKQSWALKLRKVNDCNASSQEGSKTGPHVTWKKILGNVAAGNGPPNVQPKSGNQWPMVWWPVRILRSQQCWPVLWSCLNGGFYKWAGTPKSFMFMGFSNIKHPAIGGTPIFRKPPNRPSLQWATWIRVIPPRIESLMQLRSIRPIEGKPGPRKKHVSYYMSMQRHDIQKILERINWGVSINGGTPKWMVYDGLWWKIPSRNGWSRGTPISGNLQLGNSSDILESQISLPWFEGNHGKSDSSWFRHKALGIPWPQASGSKRGRLAHPCR